MTTISISINIAFLFGLIAGGVFGVLIYSIIRDTVGFNKEWDIRAEVPYTPSWYYSETTTTAPERPTFTALPYGAYGRDVRSRAAKRSTRRQGGRG